MIKNIVFDIGKVILHWDIFNLYDKVFKTREESEKFIKDIDFYEWNLSMDSGKPFAQAIKEKQAQFPHYSKEIALFNERWLETIPYTYDEPLEVLRNLIKNNYPVYAITNFSEEKFEVFKKHYNFHNTFNGIIVSGSEKLLKPQPEIYQLLCDRYKLKPEESVFIDDSKPNTDGAATLGFKTVHFKYPDLLRPQLQALGVNI